MHLVFFVLFFFALLFFVSIPDSHFFESTAEHQKTKLENGKLKSDMLNLQQTLTKMGEEKMELNNRLSDLSVPGRL